MPNYLRGGTTISNAAALNVGNATTYAYVGAAVNVVLFIVANATTTMTIQAAMKTDGTVSAGMNTDLSAATWCNYVGFDSLSVTSGVPICIDLSTFSPQYLRLKNSVGANIASLTALVETNG